MQEENHHLALVEYPRIRDSIILVAYATLTQKAIATYSVDGRWTEHASPLRFHKGDSFIPYYGSEDSCVIRSNGSYLILRVPSSNGSHLLLGTLTSENYSMIPLAA